jgi:hypothetical protein
MAETELWKSVLSLQSNQNTIWAIQHFLEGVVQTNEKSLSEKIKANSINPTYTISAYYWCGVDLVSDQIIGSLQRQNDNKIKELEILAGRNAHSPPFVMLYNDPKECSSTCFDTLRWPKDCSSLPLWWMLYDDPVLPLLQLNPAHSLSGALPQWLQQK